MKKILCTLILLFSLTTVVYAQSDFRFDRQASPLMQKAKEAFDSSEYKTSLRYVRKELKENPENTYAYLPKALLHYVMHDYNKALKTIKKSLQKTPEQDVEWLSDNYQLRYFIYEEKNDSVRAQKALDAAVRVAPEFVEPLFVRAKKYRFDQKRSRLMLIIRRY